MFLKLTERATGNFRVVEVVDCAFRRLPEPAIHCERGTDRECVYLLEGNAYLMNSEGKTIETFPFQQPDRKTDR